MEDPGSYGAVSGSKPNWQQTNFQDRGRTHLQQQSDLSSTLGLKHWQEAPAPIERSLLRRTHEPLTAKFMAEPMIQGGNYSYHERRAAGDDPSAYRRSIRCIPDPGPLRPERPESKRILPEPYGAPPFHGGRREPSDDVRFKEASRALEPGMPRLSRPSGISGLRESEKELSYEQAFGRKIRVDQESYRGLGRAGDMSLLYGPPQRPEDSATFFKSLKDTPTFIRFCNSLPAKPAVSPHERRAKELQRNHEEQLQRDRQLVSTLSRDEQDDDS